MKNKNKTYIQQEVFQEDIFMNCTLEKHILK